MPLNKHELIQLAVELATGESLIIPSKHAKNESDKFPKKSEKRLSAGNVYDTLRRNAVKRKEKVLTLEFYMKNLPDIDRRLFLFGELVEQTVRFMESNCPESVSKSVVIAAMERCFEIKMQMLLNLREIFPELICTKVTEL